MISIKDKKDCCGCAACYSICPKRCISMKEDSEGCLYPSVDVSLCIDCGLCEKVCPILNPKPERDVHTVYAAKSRNEEQRRHSSSGGVFSLLAEWVIGNEGVVFGARFDDNWDVVHDWTDTIEGLEPFRGSKYVQSRIGDCFRKAKEFLEGGRWVLFSGTGCQIAGLNGFLKKEYDKLLTVDVICHGAPVPFAWRSYLRELSSRLGSESGIASVDFRNKKNGWQNYHFVLLPDSDDNCGKEKVIDEKFFENTFMRGFLSNLYLRPSCYHCSFKSGRSGSDITLGDFWGVDKCHPDINDDRGISAVLAYTDKSGHILADCDMERVESTIANVSASNPSLLRPVGVHPSRDKFFGKAVTFSRNVEACLRPSLMARVKRWTALVISRIMEHAPLFKHKK